LNIDSPKQWKVLPKALSASEVDKLLQPKQSRSRSPRIANALALRDKAILETFYAGALRVSEVVTARLMDLRLDEGCMLVRGKGDKERLVPLGRSAQEALHTYLKAARPQLIGKALSPNLFLAQGGHGLTRNRIRGRRGSDGGMALEQVAKIH
jgi:integrase/recombinase XerD